MSYSSIRAAYNAGAESTRRQYRMSKRIQSNITYTGRRGGRRPFRRAPTSTALRRAGIIIPRARGYQRVGGFYGRYSNGGELKFLDTQVDDAIIATGGTIAATSVNVIPQGVLENNRVGRKCTIKAINWRWQVRIISTTLATNTTDTIRIIMYLDKQCNGAAATAALILQGAAYQSYRNLENTGRFRILYDKSLAISCLGGRDTGFGENGRIGTFNKRCNIPIEYDNVANTGVLSTIRSNNIGILLLAEGGNCSFVSVVRVRFSDS